MNYLKVCILMLFSSSVISCLASPPELKSLEGKYTHSNEKDTLLIYQASPHALFFETTLHSATNQQCQFSGIVDLDIQTRKTLSIPVTEKCTFTIQLETNKLTFQDKNKSCKKIYCNNNINIDEAEFYYETRTPISTDNVKKSEKYRKASQEYFESGR